MNPLSASIPPQLQQKEKEYSIQSLVNKLKNTEPITFGNYFVNFNEMFTKEDEYKDYLKKHVSLFNDDLVNKEKYDGVVESYLKPNYFTQFKDETLFYIFYFMTRDALQLYAAEQLDKNGWKYHPMHQIWFKKDKDKLVYFNPIEWKTNDYIFGKIADKEFLDSEEIKNYLKLINSEKKDKKNKSNNKSNNNSGNIEPAKPAPNK